MIRGATPNGVGSWPNRSRQASRGHRTRYLPFEEESYHRVVVDPVEWPTSAFGDRLSRLRPTAAAGSI